MTHSTGDGQTATPGAASSGAASPGTGPRFGGESCWVDLDGPVHYLDYGGPAGASVIVAVHGLEGSAVNWSALAPLLTDRYRVLAPDLAGHGFTRSAGRGVDVSSNRVLLHRFIEAVAGHSGRVACFEAEAWLVSSRRSTLTRLDQDSTLAFCCSYS